MDNISKTVTGSSVNELEYTYWQSKDGWFIGYLNIWPDHLTQGHDLPELEVMLADLYEFYKEENEDIAEELAKNIIRNLTKIL